RDVMGQCCDSYRKDRETGENTAAPRIPETVRPVQMVRLAPQGPLDWIRSAPMTVRKVQLEPETVRPVRKTVRCRKALQRVPAEGWPDRRFLKAALRASAWRR